MAGTGVGKWSSTAGTNTDIQTVNWAENMAPSNVNNAARETLGHIRDMYEQLGSGWFEYGDGDSVYTVAYGDADTINITSASDLAAVYYAGRAIRIVDGGSNTVEGTIASTSHSSTTHTVNLTGISLATGAPTKVELGIDTRKFGAEIILDEDGDTSISAPTDDQIDIELAGADDFTFTANDFTALSGSVISTNTINETTSGSGVTIDGVLIKDSAVGATGTATSLAGIPFFSDTSNNSIYTHDVSGTDSTAANNTAYGIAALDAITTGDNNVAIGKSAASALNTGAYNVILGTSAGAALTEGISNVIIGATAGGSLTGDGGDYNVLIGHSAGAGLTTGNTNIFVGFQAGDGHDAETHNIGIGYNTLGGAIDGGEYNTAIGNYALDALTTADNVTAVGFGAGGAVTTGAASTLIGYNAGAALTTGGYSTFIGHGAGDGHDAETNNVGIGFDALGGAVNGGEYNVAVGNNTLDALTSASANTAVGYAAGGAVTTGGHNVLLGQQAGLKMTLGEKNICIGSNSGAELTGDAGDFNILIGYAAGNSLTTGDSNIFIGHEAGDGHDTEIHNLGIGKSSMGGPIAGGEYNVAVGGTTLDALQSGDNNTAVGYDAGTGIVEGGGNVCIGKDAGKVITDGDGNVFIGLDAGDYPTGTTTGDNNIAIGNSVSAATAGGDHAIAIGFNFTAAANDFSFGKQSNVVTNDFDADADWARSSDIRLKRNVESSTLGLDFINDLRPIKFQWKPSNEVPEIMKSEYNEVNQKNLDYVSHGFVAQEVKEAIDKHGDPTFGGWHLDKTDNETQRVKKNMFVMPLIKAVQELSATVTTLQQEIKTLKGE